MLIIMIRNPYQTIPTRYQGLIPSQVIQTTHTSINNIQDNGTPHDTRLRAAQTAWQALLPGRRATDEIQTPADRRQIVLSTENHTTNTHWGDPLCSKADGVTRVLSLNVNGLSLDQRGGRFDELCTFAKEVQADLLCGQEHNLDTTQSNVRRILYETTRQHWHRSRVQFATTPIPFNTYYKPGGTMIMVLGHTSGRIKSKTADHLGRWTSYTLRGRDHKVLTFISIYQVVTDTPKKGGNTAAAQQHSILLSLQDTLSAPRRAFKRDLWKYVEQCVKNHEEVLTVGDFNEVFGSDVDGMSKLAADFNLVHLMKARHSAPLPATYSRGRQCLDYGLATARFSNALHRCGYEAFNDKFTTDHRSYYFDFDTDYLFGNATQVLSSPSLRLLKSNNVEQVTQYLKRKYDYLVSRNAFERAHRLSMPGNRHESAERLDQDMLKASLDAEQKIKRFGSPAWSVALDIARFKIRIVKKCLCMHRTGIDLTTIIRRDLQEKNVDMLLPHTKADCIKMLRRLRSEVRRIVTDSFKQRDVERNERIRSLEDSNQKSDKTHAKLLRRLRRAEAIKQLFDKLKYARTRGVRQGIAMIEIPRHDGVDPKTCTDWQTIEIPTAIAHHLQQRNQKHFSQAQGSPFTIAPLADDIGFEGTGPFADDILEGLYDTHQLQDHVSLLVDHLKMTYEIANLTTFPTITRQEFIDKLKVWTESTTTSPSGLHLGHFKSLLSRHKYSMATEDTEHSSQPESETGNTQPSETASQYEKKVEWDHMQNSILDLH